MLRKLAILSISATLFFGVFTPQSKSFAAKGTITISTDGLNIRTGPGLTYPIVQKANHGQTFTIVKESSHWYMVNLGNGKTGWVANWLAKKSSPEQIGPSTSNNLTEAQVNSNGVRVRTGPGTSFQVTASLNKGDKITIVDQKDNWYKISASFGKGWINSDFIDSTSMNSRKTKGNTSPSDGMIGVVTANSLNIRQSTDLNAPIIGQVTKGQAFKIIEESNNWTKIEYKTHRFGWVASWFLDKSSQETPLPDKQAVKESTVSVLQDGTNIRKKPDTASDVLMRANAKETFVIKSIRSNWYEIKLKDGSTGFIAGWLVSVSGSVPKIEKPGAEIHLKNKTIVVDPGHGGQDSGTIGVRGTLEKNLTLRTAQLLYDKLRAAGANVILTRNNDTYVSLQSRVSTSNYQSADAFISIHYDSEINRSVRGTTGYFYHDYQKGLAQCLYSSLVRQTGMQERGVRFGDFHVIRENKQPSTLLELGYLSNPEDEMLVNSPQFQESASNGIFNGLARYFKDN